MPTRVLQAKGGGGAGGASLVLPGTAEGRLSLAAGDPLYTPLPLAPSTTDTAADTVTFATAHGYVTGTVATVSATANGLTAGTIYYLRAVDADTISFHATLATALAATSPVNLTGSITAGVAPTGVQNETLYYLPYVGDHISLYTGAAWEDFTIPEAGLSLALTTVIMHTMYDVYVRESGGAAVLALGAAWSGTTAGATTRAAALGRQDGVVVLGSDPTYKHVGTVRAVAPNTLEDTHDSARYCINRYHRRQRPMKITNSTSHSYGTNTTREWNGGTGVTRAKYVLADPEPLLHSISARYLSGTSGNPAVGIGLDTTTSATLAQTSVTTLTVGHYGATEYPTGMSASAAGYHEATVTEREYNSVAATFTSYLLVVEVWG